jgi:hypothetical protein
MKPLLCLRHHRQVKQAYKIIKNNQSMIKKLCASHQEIKAIAEQCFGKRIT